MPRLQCRFHPYRTAIVLACALALSAQGLPGAEQAKAKPNADEALALLKAGNARFSAGKTEHPHTDTARLRLAGSANQGDYAYATILACSDSRVPVERIFDAGVMDLFIIRVAGNVCNTDEIGSIEYGMAHVRTPVLVILGHAQCGAVTAVTQHLQGQGHALERNIPPLIKSIEPAVQRTIRENTGVTGPELVAKGIEANVWTSIENLFLASPAVRELVASNRAKVVGAIYDVSTGSISWLPENQAYRILGRVEVDPRRAIDAMASAEDPHSAAHDNVHTPPAVIAHGAVRAPADAHPPAVHEPAKPSTVSHPEHTALTHKAPPVESAHGEGADQKAKPTDNAHDTTPAAKPPAHGEAPAANPHEQDKTPTTKSPAGKPAEKSAHEAAADTAGATPTGGRPWGVIVVCFIVFAIGLGVALGAHFMKGKPAAGAVAGANAGAATAKAPAQASATSSTQAPVAASTK